MTFSSIAEALTGEGMMTKDTGGPRRPSQDEIARLAYHLYESRGGRGGNDVEDWLSAERELMNQGRQTIAGARPIVTSAK